MQNPNGLISIQILPSKKISNYQLCFSHRDESIVIEQNGYYYDQTDITTNGYLGFKKIGDMLPYDYLPE